MNLLHHNAGMVVKKLKVSASPMGKMNPLLQNQSTVCQETNCPNQGECFQAGVATILVMGNICTRNCLYCNIQTGKPMPLDANEPEKVVGLLRKMHIQHIVLTCVSRDDLPDGGARYLRDLVYKIKEEIADIKLEFLLPDFKGNLMAWEIIAQAPIDIYAHNMEMVPRLFPVFRSQGNWQRSLQFLAYLSQFGKTKSGFMVGMGETSEEIIGLMQLIRKEGVDILTIGQYLPPTSQNPPASIISPDDFVEYQKHGKQMGFSHVFSGSFVRSSYLAHKVWQS